MKSKKLRQFIAWRFIAVVFIISLILTVLDAFFHLSLTYRDQVRSLQRESQRICQNALPGLASSLKARDQGLIQTQLEGIIRIPNLEWVKIEHKNQVIAVCGTPPKNPGPSQTFPIYDHHKEQPRYLGTLSIQTGLTNVYKKLFREALLILPITGIRIFLTAFFILIVFRVMVARPLEAVAEYFRSFDLHLPDKPLTLPGRRADNPYPDEFDQMAGAINTICQHTKSAFTELDDELKKRLQTEEALRRSEERYRLLYEYAGDGIYTFDRNFRMTGLNRKAVELFGYREDQLIGMTILELIAIGLLQKEEAFDKTNQDVRRLISGEKLIRNEVCFARPDGSIRYGEITRAALYDGHGELITVINIIRDITKRKENEAQLLLMASVIEQADHNIIITDSNGHIQYANAFFERTGGYPRDEILGRRLSALFQEMNEEQMPSIHDALSQGSSWKGRIKAKRKNGSLYEMDLVITPIHDSAGVMTNFASFSRDVTHECEMEQYLLQVQKREALGTLAGGIAHEFNNILGAIIGYTEIELFDLPEGSRTHDNLTKIIKACLRARVLIKQIMAFTRHSDQERKVIPIDEVLQEALLLLQATLPSAIEVHYDLKTSRDLVKADPMEIYQIILNLCNNAAWAMKGKPGSLNILLEDHVPTAENGPQLRNLPPGSYLRLTIRDTGPGIDQKIIGRIFDPFFTTKEVGEGTGMGLAVVQGIVESLGGTIRVESTPGKGTAFHVYLPQSRGQESPPKRPRQQASKL